MPTTSDLKTYSTQILGSLQQIDSLLDRATGSDSPAEEIQAITKEAETILASLTRAHTGLLAVVGDGPTADPDPQHARREVAVSRAALPLEPAMEALRQIPQLIAKATAQGATHAVVLVPLTLAYRHSLDALRPLVEALDPADLARGIGVARS